jgi:4-hydroxybenzoate polyprenyltransferase/phosphoserine phosphatase
MVLSLRRTGFGRLADDGEPALTRTAVPFDAAPSPAAVAASQDDTDLLPLAVDLDGTLAATDTLHEGLVQMVFSNPLAVPGALRALLDGRAAFKRYVNAASPVAAASLPIRPELLAWLRQEKARGRSLHLVTAADQAIADTVAGHLGLFDSATGSDGVRNLSGAAKAEFLIRRFPEGFVYAGDSTKDLPVFAAARAVVLVSANATLVERVRELGQPVLASFAPTLPTLRMWLKALRVHQWSKNLLLFVPLFLGHKFGDAMAMERCIAGFVAFALTVSGTYLLNDLCDLQSDRMSPTKRRRPFASGDIPVLAGVAAAFALLVTGLGFSLALGHRFALAVLAYVCVTTAYSFSLKRVALLDTMVIASLFTLRIVLGVELAVVPYSPWLLSFAAFFFLSLALAKRHVEVLRAGERNPAALAHRGYRPEDWPLTLAFGVASGMASLLIMILYVANDVLPSRAYSHPARLYVVPAAMAIWLARIWLLANRKELHDDPVVLALRDPPSWMVGGIIAVAFVLAA